MMTIKWPWQQSSDNDREARRARAKERSAIAAKHRAIASKLVKDLEELDRVWKGRTDDA